MKYEKLEVVCRKEILKKEINFYGSIENPYFLPLEIATWLGVSNYRQMIKSADLSKDQKGVFLIDTLGGEQEVVFVNEDGLYDTLMASRKPESKPLKREIKSYLKQIRITGGYIPIKEEDSPEMIMAKGLKIADETIRKKDLIISELKPKADAYDDLMDADGWLQFLDVSGVVEIGRTKLMDFLRRNKVLTKQSNYNVPYGRFRTNGMFKVIVEETRHGKVGSVTLVSPKGLDYIYKLIHKKNMENEFDTSKLKEVSANA